MEFYKKYFLHAIFLYLGLRGLNTGKVNKRHWYSAILTWIVITYMYKFSSCKISVNFLQQCSVCSLVF